MKIFWSYLRKKCWSILLFAVFGLIFAIMLRLAGLAAGEARYAVFLCAFFGLVAAGLDFLRYRRTALRLEEALRCLPDTLLELPETHELLQQTYQEMVARLGDACRQARTQADRQASERGDYFALWIHQIKTPIAAAHLLLQGEGPPDRAQLADQLFQIERYAEMAMQYLRISGEETDFVFAWHDLDAIARQAVRKYAPLFIRSGVRLDYRPLPARVLTDEKWLCFVIEQLLSNALKYTPVGRVTVCLEGEATLVVRDTGIGIAAEDLPRVFEKGFTGYNGRQDKRATGIGLYLCRQVTDRLGHGIRIESRPGEGTAVYLELSSVRTLHE